MSATHKIIKLTVEVSVPAASLPKDAQEAAELMADEIKRISGLCREAFSSGEVFVEDGAHGQRGWWKVEMPL